MEVSYLLGDQDAIFEEPAVYRKLKVFGTQVIGKIRRSGVYRQQLDPLIDQPLGGFK